MATTPVYGFPYQTLSDPPDGAALGEELAQAVEPEIARIDASLSAINGTLLLLNTNWVSYTTAWTCVSGGNPVAASHTIISRYKYIDESLAVAQCKVTFGSANFGGGVYLFTLPFATASALIATGTGHALNTGVAEYALQSGMFNTTQVRLFSGSANVSNSAPFTFGAADVLTWQIMFEPA